jgi:hypothetical protein
MWNISVDINIGTEFVYTIYNGIYSCLTYMGSIPCNTEDLE